MKVADLSVEEFEFYYSNLLYLSSPLNPIFFLGV